MKRGLVSACAALLVGSGWTLAQSPQPTTTQATAPAVRPAQATGQDLLPGGAVNPSAPGPSGPIAPGTPGAPAAPGLYGPGPAPGPYSPGPGGPPPGP